MKQCTQLLVAFAAFLCGGCEHTITRTDLPFPPESVHCSGLDFTSLKAAEARGNYRDYEKEIQALLPIGSSVERVICVLEGTGWSYGCYKGNYGAYKDWGWLVTFRANLWVEMSKDDRVEKVHVTVMGTFI